MLVWGFRYAAMDVNDTILLPVSSHRNAIVNYDIAVAVALPQVSITSHEKLTETWENKILIKTIKYCSRPLLLYLSLLL